MFSVRVIRIGYFNSIYAIIMPIFFVSNVMKLNE